tara:strand:- start:665 stop:2413 length:1749 start_codon:yes stop_codon:yes gene_type:complete
MKKAQVIFVVTNTNEDNARKIRTSFDTLEGIDIKDIKSPDFSKEKEENIDNILEKLPAGSIIAKTKFSDKSDIIICLPLMSSHFQISIKKGEDIWYFEDESKYTSNSNSSFIKNYWLSRIYSFEEDVNFTHHERDFEKNNQNKNKDIGLKEKKGAKTTRSNKNKKLNTKDGIEKPRFLEVESMKSNDHINTNVESIIKSNISSGFSFKAIPRFYDGIGSTTIQGSNNTIINLGTNLINKKDTGAIDIVTGRLSLIDEVYSESIRKTKNYNVLSSKTNKTAETITFSYNEKYPYYKISNSIGIEETLKDATHYSVKASDLKGSPKEFNRDIEADASRIYISEKDNLDSGYINNEFIEYQTNITDDDSNNSIQRYNDQYPSILCKTNHLRIYARKPFENSKINSSSVRIIKESDKYKNYSHICLENNGNILIDGKKILIGNFKRSALDQEIISEEDIKSISRKQKKESDFSSKFENMAGKGDTIILGHSEDLSEPLVLGESLVKMLTSLLDSNIEVLRNVKDALNKIENHNHTSAAPGSPNTPMRSITMFSIDNHKKNVEDQIPVLEDLKNNIKKVLSKVSKSS